MQNTNLTKLFNNAQHNVNVFMKTGKLYYLSRAEKLLEKELHNYKIGEETYNTILSKWKRIHELYLLNSSIGFLDGRQALGYEFIIENGIVTGERRVRFA